MSEHPEAARRPRHGGGRAARAWRRSRRRSPGASIKLFVHFGDSVKPGAPLFTLDSPDLVAAQSDYLKAKSALAQAEKNLARQKDLTEHGIGAQRELEQAQTDRDTAQSELDRTTTRLRLLGIGPGASAVPSP